MEKDTCKSVAYRKVGSFTKNIQTGSGVQRTYFSICLMMESVLLRFQVEEMDIFPLKNQLKSLIRISKVWTTWMVKQCSSKISASF